MLGPFALVGRSALLSLLIWLSAPAVALAGAVNATTFGNVAIDGADPVAYFQDGRAVLGSSDFELEWNGAVWRFANAANRAAFEADPELYAPQYGGYCAWAVSQGYTASIDPEAWKIVDGKLYLNYSKGVQRRWEEDIPSRIREADANWPSLKTQE
ncbi:MAG: YHS domain-containing (seleno)protein [Alphaproteobacteria bacterium]|nr:YHS domain-containing (seleno)protein [Alphaproteobacteria bacterium]